MASFLYRAFVYCIIPDRILRFLKSDITKLRCPARGGCRIVYFLQRICHNQLPEEISVLKIHTLVLSISNGFTNSQSFRNPEIGVYSQ